MRSDEAKFNIDFIDFVNSNFDMNEHLFLLSGTEHKTSYLDKQNAFIGTGSFLLTRAYWIYLFQRHVITSKKIIIHGLFDPYIVVLLFLQPWLLKKCYWVIWGGDLHFYKTPKSFFGKCYEFMRAFCIKRFGGLVTYLQGDYDLACQWYKARGVYKNCIMYPSNIFRDENRLNMMQDTDKEKLLYIQVGNSADRSNNHVEIFDSLTKLNRCDFKIICPLSYGNREYAEQVVNYGTELFGDRFVPLMEFLAFQEYIEILSRIDVAIFNHKRQQAMGNIITLLGLGKTVYIRSDITTWGLLDKLNLKVFSSNLIEELNLLTPVDKEKNMKKVSLVFSKTRLLKQWEGIFYE